MNFKDAVQGDIGTFLNLDEFADEHDINGLKVASILDEDLKDRDTSRSNKSDYAEGVFFVEVNLYVAAQDGIWLPVVGEFWRIAGKQYTFLNPTEDNGIYIIRLGKNDS